MCQFLLAEWNASVLHERVDYNSGNQYMDKHVVLYLNQISKIPGNLLINEFYCQVSTRIRKKLPNIRWHTSQWSK